jgi:quercetin dioxygenase-like cupin family protein
MNNLNNRYEKKIKRDIVFLLLFANLGLIAQPGSKKAGAPDSVKIKYTIDNCINTFSMDKIEKTKVGYQYWFVDRDFVDGKTLKMSVVKPHEATHPPHVHPEDEFFFILEGQAEVYLNGEWRSVKPYTSFYCQSNVEHGIRNTTDKELKYLVFKKYEVNK